MSGRRRAFGWAAALLFACSGATDDGAATTQLGDSDYTLRLLTGAAPHLELRRRDQVLLQILADGIQVGTVPALEPSRSYNPYWLEAGDRVLAVSPPADLRWHSVISARLGSPTPAATLSIDLTLSDGISARLRLAATASGRFVGELFPDPGTTGRSVAYLRLRAIIDGSEGLYGMGEWADRVNQRGTLRPMQLEIDTLESANNENRVPVPLLLGTTGWGLFVESRRLGAFDVALKRPDAVEATFGTAEQSAAGLRFHLFAAEQPLDLLRRYYDVTGDPLLPAEWAYGPWIWRDETRDQAQALDDIAKIRSLDLATSAIWLDRPYSTRVNSFDFDPKRYRDPQQVVAAAHAAGLRLALWSAPYLEPGSEPYRSEALKLGYFPPKVGPLLNSWGTPIDFTNPAAFTAWQKWLRVYTDLGVEGFKLDYGEDVIPSVGDSRNIWRFADGSDERTAHYGYTLAYHRAYAELLPASGGFLLGRVGRWGDQRQVSVIWPGDMDATFTQQRERFGSGGKLVEGVGGLPATVAQGLSLSASGYPFFAADTGGFRHSPADNELFIRWFEQTALSAVMQVGDSTSAAPWEFTAENGRDSQTLELYRRYTRLHLRLFPYAWSYAQAMKRTGRPILRPFGLAYPELGQHPADQYLFGDDLLVAPVLSRGATTRTLLVPPGPWVSFWDGTLYDGAARQIEVPAPLDRLPLLVRAGALIPLLRPDIDTLSPATDPGVESFANDAGPLSVLVVPLTLAGPNPKPASFAVFDGTQLEQSASGDSLRLAITAGQRFRRGTLFQVLRRSRPSRVTLDGSPLAEVADQAALAAAQSGWLHQPGDPTPSPTPGTLFIKLPAAALRPPLAAAQQVQID